MKITIHPDRIDITEIPLHDGIEWNPILDELKAEHLPGFYQAEKRMGVSGVAGQTHVYIYRTDKTPPEPEIRAILKRHGIL